VFANIIQNAIVYNKPSGKVYVDIHDKKTMVEIIIKDTGIGMSNVDLKYVFDRFYRADKSRSRSFGGSGLGLSIAKQIIESVNGGIDIESELDKGTTVKIILPKA
jgi:signal transduction histidine kinase